MADYIATARSNYFKVKDETAFRAWCEALNLTVIGKTTKDGVKRLGFLVATDHGTVPSYRYDETTDDFEDIEFAKELAEHLADEPGNVAIYMEAGAEKMRFVKGYAAAVNAKGEVREVSLGDILNLAKEIGLPDPTPVFSQPEY